MTAPYIEMIPLKALKPSEHNVRKTPATAEEDAELEASIEAHGVRQNLQVLLSEPADGADTYEVVAGGRRFAALLRIAQKGGSIKGIRVDGEYPVPCLVVDEHEEVTEISLVENVVRAGMHPADQMEAFEKLHTAGHTVEEIAARFGLTPLTVEKRLKLGTVHPEILQAYRDEELNMEAVMAFTLCPDPEEQRAVFQELGGRAAEWAIRDRFTGEKMSSTHAAAQYVGLEAYEQAGGTFTRDLFTDLAGSQVFLDDPPLMRSLAAKKLEGEKAGLLAQGWKWADVLIDYDYQTLAEFDRFTAPAPEPTAAEAEKLAALERQMDALDEQNEGDGEADDAWAELERQHENLTEAIEARQDFTPEQKAAAGVVLSPGYGGIKRYPGLIRREDAKQAAAVAAAAGHPSSGNGAVRHRATAAKRTDPEADARKQAGYSQALADDLRHIRTAIVRAELAGHPDVAGDLLVFQLSRQILADRTGHQRTALDVTARITATHPTNRYGDDGFSRCNPGEARWVQIRDALQEQHAGWLGIDPEQADRSVAACWAAFRGLTSQAKQHLLAFCVAAMVENQLGIEPGRAPELEAAIDEIAPPLADARLSADLFWERIPKKAILAAMEEAGNPEWADENKGFKKKELAEYAEHAFANPDGEPFSEETRDAIRNWTPPGFLPALNGVAE